MGTTQKDKHIAMIHIFLDRIERWVKKSDDYHRWMDDSFEEQGIELNDQTMQYIVNFLRERVPSQGMSIEQITLPPPPFHLRFDINERIYYVPTQDVYRLLEKAVPPFLRSASEPATLQEDVIRGFIRMGWDKFFRQAMTKVYGSVPELHRRADKLPYLWPCLFNFILQQLVKQRVAIYADESSIESIWDVTAIASIPLLGGDAQPTQGTQASDGAEGCGCEGEAATPQD